MSGLTENNGPFLHDILKAKFNADRIPESVTVPIGSEMKAQLEAVGCDTMGLPESVTAPISDELRHAFEAMLNEPVPQKFVPTLENVRAYYKRQRIPNILELGPEASPGGYHFVVERDAPESCKKAVDKMYPTAVGTRWNNLLLAVDENSMTLRHNWETSSGASCKSAESDIECCTMLKAAQEQKSGGDPLTLENVRAYFAAVGRGTGIEPDDITALGPEVGPGMYPVMLRNLEDWHVARISQRCPDLPDGYNNFLLAKDGMMEIRFAC